MKILSAIFSSENFTALSILSALVSGCLWSLSTLPPQTAPFNENAAAAALAIISALLALASIIRATCKHTHNETRELDHALVVIANVFDNAIPDGSQERTHVHRRLDQISKQRWHSQEISRIADTLKNHIGQSHKIEHTAQEG